MADQDHIRMTALLEAEASGEIPTISDLKLSATQRELAIAACEVQVAINVYRQCKKMYLYGNLAESGYEIIGGCSSCCC